MNGLVRANPLVLTFLEINCENLILQIIALATLSVAYAAPGGLVLGHGGLGLGLGLGLAGPIGHGAVLAGPVEHGVSVVGMYFKSQT